MSARVVQPEGWPSPKGYANGMLAPPGAAMLFVSGQIAWDTAERLVSDQLEAQFVQALRNVRAVVEAAGGSAQDVVRMTFYVVDKADYARCRPALADGWRAVFGRHYPACTLVEVKDLLEDGALVEIEATAALTPE